MLSLINKNGLWNQEAHLSAANASWVESIYEQWLQQPHSVPSHWIRYFESLADNTDDVSHQQIREQIYQHHYSRINGVAKTTAPTQSQATISSSDVRGDVRGLVYSYRYVGYQYACFNPLSGRPDLMPPELSYSRHGFSDADLDRPVPTQDFVDFGKNNLRQLIDHLNEIYCADIGIELMHMPVEKERIWLCKELESYKLSNHYGLNKQRRMHTLQRLVAAEGLSQYLASHYPGVKRFDLEGGETLIPVLDEMIRFAADADSLEIVLGMAHRGRLNALVNLLGKTPDVLFDEFEGKYSFLNDAIANSKAGDVKYHQGFSSNVNLSGHQLHLALVFNPSHLEIVAPVVQGSVRARQDRRRDLGGNKVLPIIVHGDAAIAAQGVVMECLQMSKTRAYRVGGTVHIVLNNQIGFTTSDQRDARSSKHCTDPLKMLGVPVLHVNGDNPDAAVFAAHLAMKYRNTFKKDVALDLVCYRRFGHNEADEPAITQPKMYQQIKKHPSVFKQYSDRLIKDNITDQEDISTLCAEYRHNLEKGIPVAPNIATTPNEDLFVDWSAYGNDDARADLCDTTVPLGALRDLSKKINILPKDFNAHSVVAKTFATRHKMVMGKQKLNWGCAEMLAYASLVHDGYGVRLVGQDSRRGTFSHRHAVVFDQKSGEEYCPLESLALKEEQSRFMVYDSLLSELGSLGFEYGYATTAPNVLVLWEAQFGDFCNGAQIIIDQFLSSGEYKWGRLCGLCLLLPHGHEGQGAEHSSARLERFLQLCANDNMRLCVPTQAAQIFHLLRRQLLHRSRKPLIVMSPKSLLRHPGAASLIDDLSTGGFSAVLVDHAMTTPDRCRRLLLCSGKIYFDLLEHHKEHNIKDTLIVRLEQLYPFPDEDLVLALSRYRNLNHVYWCQEEPRNQGAWYHIRHCIVRVLAKTDINLALDYVGRDASAVPAVATIDLHRSEQTELVKQAFSYLSIINT